MHLHRREFLGASMAAAAALAIESDDCSAKEAAAESRPIIDTHQHLWDLEQFQPPWLREAPKVLNRSYKTSDYLEATKGLNVVKAVYMEIDVAPRDQVREAEHVIQLCESDQHPTVAAVISGRPNSAEFGTYLSRFKNSPWIKGVRQVLHAPSAERGLCLQPQFVKSMQLLGERGLSFDLCMRPTELADGVRLADLCKDTQFVVDHCGNADPHAFVEPAQGSGEKPTHQVAQWKRDISALAERPNVTCKISGIVARAPQPTWEASHLAPIINFCLDRFGPDRVVFGGDWPVCKLGGTYRQWVTALKEVIADRSAADQKKLLHDNAIKIYRLA